MSNQISVEPINTTQVSEYEGKAVELTGLVAKLTIVNQTSYETAADLLKSIKAMSKDAEEARKKITSPLDACKTAVMDLFRPISTRLDNSERHIKSLMIAYSTEQERLRAAQEEKLRKQAEAEEKKKREALEARAAKALADGKTEKAEELQQQAAEVYVPAPILASTVQKPAGVSMRKLWKARVIDANKVPRGYLMVDEKKLDAQAKATQDSLAVPGVEFYFENVLASR